MAPVSGRVVRISPVALLQKVAQQLERHRNGDPYPVIAIGAQPVWPHDPDLVLPDGRRVKVVAAVSPLAIWEQVVADRDEQVLVLLTDVPESELGAGLCSRLFRQRIIAVQPWDLVVEAFGAQLPDAALEAEEWAGEALLEAMPPGGWPKLTGSVLSRDVALRHLATIRLGVERLGAVPDDLDVALLLRWSALPGAVEAFGLLRPAEQDGLAGWLANRFGRPAQALFALVAAGHGADALPLGLVCDALWTTDTAEAMRARGRVDQYFGSSDRDDQTIRTFSAAGLQVVASMLAAPAGDAATRRQGHAMIDRAEELLVAFGAIGCASHSGILRTGFTHRLGQAADALTGLNRPDLNAIEAAVTYLAAHQLAAAEADRIRRVRMAQRLVRWLDTEVEPPHSVADGIDRQIAEWGWVDLALNHVWAGDIHPGLQTSFREVYERAHQRRRDLDRTFAQRLAAWTAAGPGNDGELLTVEGVLPRVVEPLLRAGQPTLLVVLDGMSAAAAVELAGELSQHWVEYDPVAAGGPGRRRGVVAALPTLTAVSRTSLFAGALSEGNQETERRIFTQGRWGKHARIFHKGPSRGAAGEVLAADLTRAIADPQQFVAVVVNTVDDSLAYGREGDEAGWQISDIGPLRSLLDLARSAGRAVIVTSDHGHVLDRGGQQVRMGDAASARHRTGEVPAGPGEIELAGPRVVADDNRIVALWDPQLRYRPARAGYHGGASLAEVTVPLLAFLLPNVTDTPTGWAAIEARQPDWWQTPTPAAVAPSPAPAKAPKPRRKAPTDAGEALFDVPAVAAQPATQPAVGHADLVATLMETELFQAQQALTPRRLPTTKIAAALTALLDAGGVLPTAVLAERAGESPARAAGFVTTLQRVFNVDNYPVLGLTEGGRTVRLNVALLRQQFNLPGVRP